MSRLANVRRRIYLTYRYQGGGTLVYRAVTFPLRATPLRPYLGLEANTRTHRSIAARWYRRHGRPVTVVIPSYRDAEHVAAAVASIRRTTRPRLRRPGSSAWVRIVVADDASGPEHLARLRRIRGIEIVEGRENAGFAANVNRGLAAAGRDRDVVVLNSDVIARPGWLACLQYAADHDPKIGVLGAKLLYRDGRIQFAGTVRNRDAPEWFDHRYRFKPGAFGPARPAGSVLAVTGACMYIKRDVIARVGRFDEAYPMAYEDVDYCLRVWQAGYRVHYCSDAELYHLESVTRGAEVTERERTSQQVFWERWGTFFDARDVRTAEGRLRVIFVTEDTGVGGGHRVVFEQANQLLDRGHEVEVWSLSGPPTWFELRTPVRSFKRYADLIGALKPLQAIKVATWWVTAAAVWEASVLDGIPVYFVQDIETSYYRDSERLRNEVLASYRPEFHYLTTSSWNREQLQALGMDPTVISPGIDLSTFHPIPDAPRREDVVLALGRSNPLKNLPLTLAAWRALPDPRPELLLFGIEPHVADEPGVRYVSSPSDSEVNELLAEATVFVQTSVHEGFCLPALEAMATGCAVVCTDAHGNRDFCEDGRNCLMPASNPESVTAALLAALRDPALRSRLGEAGVETAADYSWPKRIDALEAFLNEIAAPRRIEPSTEAVPELRRQGVR